MITEGSGLEKIDVKDELNMISNFRSIDSLSKIACRLKLLFSPTRDGGIFKISCDELTVTSGDTDVKKCSKGNCFAPPIFFEKLIEVNVCTKADNTV